MQTASLAIHESDELVGVNFVLVGADFDEVDQSQNAAQTEAQAQNDLQNALLGFAHHEVVNTKTTQQQANNNHCGLILASQIARRTGLLHGNTTV